MQQLAATEQQIKDLLQKRSRLKSHLQSIENSIFQLETNYLDQHNFGNIVRGYHHFLTQRTPARKQRQVERLFSACNNIAINIVQQQNDDEFSNEDEFVVEKSRKKKKASSRPRKMFDDED